MSARMCSCGRAPAEPGCDLCSYCEEDWLRECEEREDEEGQMPDEDFYIPAAAA